MFYCVNPANGHYFFTSCKPLQAGAQEGVAFIIGSAEKLSLFLVRKADWNPVFGTQVQLLSQYYTEVVPVVSSGILLKDFQLT